METSAATADSVRGEAQLAVWNALKLGGSLVLTWSLALAVRALLPRYLGPEAFGAYTFADAVATTFFVFCTLGVETYVQKSVPIRHEHASEFFGGVVLVRLVLGLALLTLMCAGLALTGRPPEIVLAAALFGVGQLFFIHNATFVSMLNARGKVDGMSVVNVLAKTGWAACIFAAVGLRLPLWAFAASFIVGEAVRNVALFRLCRRHLGLRLVVDRRHVEAGGRPRAPVLVN
jgi:O-antigen/teichoic acid export membrane protein